MIAIKNKVQVLAFAIKYHECDKLRGHARMVCKLRHTQESRGMQKYVILRVYVTYSWCQSSILSAFCAHSRYLHIIRWVLKNTPLMEGNNVQNLICLLSMYNVFYFITYTYVWMYTYSDVIKVVPKCRHIYVNT